MKKMDAQTAKAFDEMVEASSIFGKQTRGLLDIITEKQADHPAVPFLRSIIETTDLLAIRASAGVLTSQELIKISDRIESAGLRIRELIEHKE